MRSKKKIRQEKFQRLIPFVKVAILIAIAFVVVKSLFVPSSGVAGEQPATPSLQGYCPVSYFQQSSPVTGNPQHRSIFRGRSYYFVDAAAKQKFNPQPEKYVPQFDGLCTTALGGSYGNRLSSDPTVFSVRKDKLYLFSSVRAKNAYDRRPDHYINRGNELFAQPSLRGYCTVSYLTKNKAVKGDEQFQSVYHGWTYYFAGDSERVAFEKNPQKFLPQYEGFCALSVSQNKKYPGEPISFIVKDGKTYLFFDEKDKAEFMQNAAELFKQAEVNWPALSLQKTP